VSDTLAEEIAELPRLNRAQLCAKWRAVLKKEPPAHLRKQLLVPLLAYKMQGQTYGGLRPEVKRHLRELADSFEPDSNRSRVKHQMPLRMKSGTRLIRQWQGETHHVTVSDRGFEYDGRLYSSLSEIARLITGTRWSGPLFFGIKQTRKGRGRS
jgi:hypothetical protein